MLRKARTELMPGPPAVGEAIRAFRYLTFFGIACVAENKHPALTRCWKELEKLYMRDPAFDDGVFVQSWILLNFPFGPKHETVLDLFADFLRETGAADRFQPFIEAAGKSRLGLHQDIGRTKQAGKFRELFTRREVSALPTLDAYGRGEIFLTRMLTIGDQSFLFGNPKGFPADRKKQIEDMVVDKLFTFAAVPDIPETYETFMKLAGPYWMSCVTSDYDAPILDPDHYLTYLGRERAEP